MSILGSNMLAGAAGRAKHEIERSLRFNSGDSTYLNRTPGSAGDRTEWTWSAWIKRSGLGSTVGLFGSYTASNNTDYLEILFASGNNLLIQGNSTVFLKTSQLFRDVSAWYHIVIAVDTSNTTANDRIKLWVNGQQATAFDIRNNPSSGGNLGVNQAGLHRLGRRPNTTDYFNGYIAEVNFIDGTALDASYFGETDLETGAWIPKKYRGSFGTNGFYLNFADNSGVTATTLGKDSSGNGNNWTPNNFSVTAGAGNDSLLDTPTSNWCTLNPVNKSYNQPTFSNGSLNVAPNAGNYQNAFGSIPVFSGKWYGECKLNGGPNSANMIGVSSLKEVDFLSQGNDYVGDSTDGYSVQLSTGNKHNDAGSSFTSAFADGDVFGIALDLDNGKVWFSKNGTYPDSGDPAAGFNAAFTGLSSSDGFLMGSTVYSGGVSSFDWNFGQRAFAYTPPAGFQALNTKNLPTPTVLDGTKYFNTALFTGNGSTNSITGVGFQPDWTWIKMRSDGTRGFGIFDSVRGGLERLDSSGTMEGRTNEGNISFQPDGFNITSSHPSINDSPDSAVAWNWKKSVDAGFDIVADVGTGAAKTVSHNLGVAPKLIIRKSRTSGFGHWYVYHYEQGASKAGILQLTNTFATQTAWNSTEPTSSVFSVGSNVDENKLNDNYISYVFAEVEGYSKFGSYTGNGSNDGPYVATNFRPAWVLVKSATNTNGWYLADTARSPFNVSQATLSPHTDDAEDTTAGGAIDILSNGFKARNSAGQFNDSGQTYVYLAFAETPFKYANAR